MRVREQEVPLLFLKFIYLFYVDFYKKVVVLRKITAAKMPFSRPAEVTLTVLRVCACPCLVLDCLFCLVLLIFLA